MLKSQKIDAKIQRGRDKEAQKLGVLFDVYRHGTLIAPRIFMRPERTTQRDLIEAAVSLRDIVFMDLICDAINFRPGDVFKGDDPNDRYILGFKWPAKNNIGFRCEVPITLQRPNQAGAGGNNVAPYGGQLSTTNLSLNYDSATHNYSFGTGSADTVFSSKARTGYGGQMPSGKLPLDVRESQWIFVLELLPGLTIQMDDLVLYGGQVYQVQAVDSQLAGFTGQIVYTSLKRP